jgi:RNA polymerase sigma-70 factor, ECF subfamily
MRLNPFLHVKIVLAPIGVGGKYDVRGMGSLRDSEVAERLLARDEDTLRSVIREYGGAVYATAKRVISDPTLAEEVAQDSFVVLWRRPGAFDPERGTLIAFLLGITRNKAVDLVRKEESARRTTASLLAEAEATSRQAPANEEMVEAERRQDVKDALSRLSEVQREAIVLAYFGGRTYREVAEELAIPEGTAKTRLRDGLTRLRELMALRRGS